MARPTTKADLLQAAEQEFKKLQSVTSSMNDLELSTPFDFTNEPKKKEAHWGRDKNLRDVLIHLYEWHHLLLNWINSNQAGETKPFLPEPYNWKNYGDLNIELWKKHQETSLEDATAMLDKSHKDVLAVIETFSNDELFMKKQFFWTGTTTLGSYCISATASHYGWAIKKLKAHINNCKI